MRVRETISSVKLFLVGVLSAAVISVLFRLIRWTHIVPADVFDRSDSVIIAFWHNRIVMMPKLYMYHRGGRSAPAYMLISQHGDGRIIAWAIRVLGIRSVAGSSSRGGLKALLELMRRGRAGSDMGFTPDGPRGPRYEVKEGLVVAAAKTGCVVVPCAYSTSRSWTLRSWDGMLIPQPFSRGVFMAGEGVSVAAGEDLEQARLKIQNALNEITRRADEYWSAT
jgi:lysophospholipid acyltransferase (LPLAT)-like uncharacterized protein